MTDRKQQIEAQIASLREIANDQSYCGEPGRKNTCAAAWRMDDAADSLQALLEEIERLQSLLEAANEMEADREVALQEIERLRAALERIANLPPGHICDAREIAEVGDG